MQFFRDLWATTCEWWRFASIKLAALAAAASAVFTANPELLVGLLGVIPVDPILRLFFSLGVAAVVFLIPFIARVWPQDIDLPKSAGGASDAE